MKRVIDILFFLYLGFSCHLCGPRNSEPQGIKLTQATEYHFLNPNDIDGFSGVNDTANAPVFVSVFLKHFHESDSLYILSARFPLLSQTSPFCLLGFTQIEDTVIVVCGEEAEQWPDISSMLGLGPLNSNVSAFNQLSFVPPKNESISKLRVTVGSLVDGKLFNIRNETRGLRFYKDNKSYDCFITAPVLRASYLEFINGLEDLPNRDEIKIAIFCFSDNDSSLYFKMVASTGQIKDSGRASYYEADSDPFGSITISYECPQIPISIIFDQSKLKKMNVVTPKESDFPSTPLFYGRKEYLYDLRTGTLERLDQRRSEATQASSMVARPWARSATRGLRAMMPRQSS